MKLSAKSYLLPWERQRPVDERQFASMLERLPQQGMGPLPIEHWSPSAFDMFWRCPRQWQERYLHGRKERPNEAPVLGSAVHKTFERNFEQKIKSHVDLPVAELLEWYMDEGFLSSAYEQEEKAGEPILWKTDWDSTRDRGKAMVAAYQHDVAPRVQPLATETKIEVDFGLPVPVIGYFDVERDESVIDMKTGTRKQSTPKESWKIQAAVYGEARRKPVEFHHMSATATGAVTIVTPLESEAMFVNSGFHEREEMRRRLQGLAAMAQLFWDIYGPDEPWPTMGRLSTWACDWCGFRSDCPAWKEE